MLKRRYVALILVLVFVLIATTIYYYNAQRANPSQNIYAGFWMPIVHESLPLNYVINLTKQMNSSIQGLTLGNLTAGNIWDVGGIDESAGTCILNFPYDQEYPHMYFRTQDQNENYLTSFDNNGIKVWLEVEPGFANISQLIDLVLERYGHHLCVLGFAVDLEYHWGWPSTRTTVPVTNAEANQWVNKIKSHNTNYKLILIHWLTNIMPPTVREGIVFINDAQNFDDLDSLMNTFKEWSQNFSQTDVGYIFGYSSDLKWFSEMGNPPREIGSALIQNIPNCRFIFWSIETRLEVFLPP